MNQNLNLEFTWTSTAEEAQFVCDMELSDGKESLDDQIEELLKWIKAHLKKNEYTLTATRTDTVSKQEIFGLEHGKLVAEGNTIFKPWQLRIDLKMPIKPAAVFSMAFNAKQSADPGRKKVSIPVRQPSPFY